MSLDATDAAVFDRRQIDLSATSSVANPGTTP
jgi:hypothetical protein